MRKKSSKILAWALLAMLVLSFMPTASFCTEVYAEGSDEQVTKEEASPTYRIKVNKQCNVVTVYSKNSKGKYKVPEYVFLCSCGEATPLGVYKTTEKYDWRALVENSWGQYATRIVGSILFHSVPYSQMDPGTLIPGEFDKLGELASHGCVRLCVRDAKWIYDNCEIGTEVEIYEDEDPGPLGKPEGDKIGDESTWDPTDVWSALNPYFDPVPTIELPAVSTIAEGDEFDLLDGVSAVSCAGDDITDSIVVHGKVGSDRGVYRLVYSVTDPFGRSANKTRFIRVR